MSKEKTIEIVSQFSKSPGGRYRTDGAYSGEVFRDEHLIPELESNGRLCVVLDGTSGYGSSFLEEAFGGLVRSGRFDFGDIQQRLSVVANTKPYEHYRKLALRYMEDAATETS